MNDNLQPTPDAQARQWAMLCHYAAFFWVLAPLIGNVIGPLVVWQLKKDLHPFVDEQGKEALNFQITYGVAMMVCGLLAWVLIGLGGLACSWAWVKLGAENGRSAP